MLFLKLTIFIFPACKKQEQLLWSHYKTLLFCRQKPHPYCYNNTNILHTVNLNKHVKMSAAQHKTQTHKPSHLSVHSSFVSSMWLLKLSTPVKNQQESNGTGLQGAQLRRWTNQAYTSVHLPHVTTTICTAVTIMQPHMATNLVK